MLPLTPLQQGLLFHAGTAQGSDDVYAVQLDITITGPLEPQRLREAVHTVITRHPQPGGAVLRTVRRAGPGHPGRSHSGVAVYRPGRRRAAVPMSMNRSGRCAPPSAPRCATWPTQSAFRAALIRTGPDRHRFVLTNHHIVVDGWSLPILLGEIFAGYYRQPLPPAVPYRRFVSWLAERDLDAARAAWGEVLAGFDTPTLVGPPDRLGLGARGVASHRLSEQTTRALAELARSRHTTVNTVLQAAWAQLLCGLTGQHDVAFGAVVSGRPTELAGAESMVGLLINTVPVRATLTAATTAAELLEQLHAAHHHTLEHQHLALSEIHRAHRS